ncbi:TPA: hypothetical protein OT855_003666 [Serratia liquefaciens]|jgi:hypothetical protein|nr:hypothetical protein [Serratia liquefaciens]
MEQILWLIDKLIEWKRINPELRKTAVDGLTPAVASTIHYTTSRTQGAPRNMEIERDLYGLWYAASASVYRIDKALARDCIAKAEYWLFRDTFNEENDYKIDELNIRLKRMKAVLEQLKHS